MTGNSWPGQPLETTMPAIDKLPIRLLAWSGLAVLALLATAAALLASSLIDLAGDWVAGGQAREAAAAGLRLPLPEWISVFIDPAWLRAAQSAALHLLDLARDAQPWLAQGIGLLKPVVWILWALFVGGLLLLGLRVHLLAGDYQRAVTRHKAPSGESVSR